MKKDTQHFGMTVTSKGAQALSGTNWWEGGAGNAIEEITITAPDEFSLLHASPGHVAGNTPGQAVSHAVRRGRQQAGVRRRAEQHASSTPRMYGLSWLLLLFAGLAVVMAIAH